MPPQQEEQVVEEVFEEASDRIEDETPETDHLSDDIEERLGFEITDPTEWARKRLYGEEEEPTDKCSSGDISCTCGNGRLESGEACDGTNLDGESCQSQGYEDGELACASDCSSFDDSACTNGGCTSNADCGDGETCRFKPSGAGVCM